jgi:hypothetical protein
MPSLRQQVGRRARAAAVMNADRVIRYSTIGAVASVGLTAAVLSYRHQFELAAGHGESALTDKLLPISIDGLLLAGTLAVLDASRRQTGHAWAARITVGLGVGMTMWANIVHGLAFGWTGIILSGWPPVALMAAIEVLARMVRPAPVPALGALPAVLAQVAPADSAHAAQLALSASVAAGNPISQRQMMARFGLSRAAERRVRQAVLAQSNGHAVPELAGQ